MTLIARLIGASLAIGACFAYGQDSAPQVVSQQDVNQPQLTAPVTEQAVSQEPLTEKPELAQPQPEPPVVAEQVSADNAPESEPETQIQPEPQPEPGAPRDASFNMGDVTIHYHIVGTGKPLLLLHGFLDAGDLWQPYIDALAENYMVIIPDMRGHGRSTNPSGKFSYADAAADVAALMGQLNIAKFDAVGYSEGALILTRVAIEQPKRIGKLTLIGAGPYMLESGRNNLRKIQYFTNLSKSLQAELIRLHQSQEKAESLVAQFNGLANDYSEPNFTPPLLSKIEADVLMINSVPDKYFLLEPALEQYRHINKVNLWVIPDRGHNLVFYDAPEALQAEFLRVLQNHLNK